MYSVRNHDSQDLKKLHDECKNLMYYHVSLTMTDGTTFDGIIENVDDDKIVVLVGEDIIEQDSTYSDSRQFGGPRRFRRFNRRIFPLAGLAALALLAYPYYAPYYNPYYYPYYPY